MGHLEVIIATGSEVEVAGGCAQQLAAEGLAVRVVSMPCVELFSAQDAEYQQQVLPPAVRARVAVEAGHPDLWHKFVDSTALWSVSTVMAYRRLEIRH